MSELRINILGASGSGTSTTGRALAQALSIEHFESDDFYHAPTDPPYQKQREPQERYELLLTTLAPVQNWVLSGGVAGWEPYPQLNLTLIVFLWVPTDLRLRRLHTRERQRFGERISAGGDMFEEHCEFIEWAQRYDIGDRPGKSLARHEAYLAKQSCQVLQIRETLPTADLVKRIIAVLG